MKTSRIISAYFFSILLPALMLLCNTVYSEAPSYKQRIAGKVFRNICDAIGERVPPILQVKEKLTDDFIGAAWFRDRQVIELQESLYDLCSRMGADSLNALAFILGHELAHYRMNHGWYNEFGMVVKNMEDSGPIVRGAEADRIGKIETEADLFGGFFSALSKYNSLGVAGQVLDSLYKQYGLENKLSGYPALEDRKRMATAAKDELDKLLPVFEAGNSLLLVGRYLDAARCFEVIGRKKFQSREILNNTGVAYALAAVQIGVSGNDPDARASNFAYPFEFDAETRLRHANGGKGIVTMETKDSLLDLAIRNFNYAIASDKEFATGYLNRACVYCMKGNLDAANSDVKSALSMSEAQGEIMTISNAKIVTGIILALQSETQKAVAIFEKEKKKNALVDLNIEALKTHGLGLVGKLEDSKEIIRIGVVEKISDQKSDPDFMEMVMNKSHARFKIAGIDEDRPEIIIYGKSTVEWEAIVLNIHEGYLCFLTVPKGYKQKTARGIQLGSSKEDVYAAYGEPAKIIASRQSSNLVYEKASIVFQIDAENNVAGWKLWGKFGM